MATLRMKALELTLSRKPVDVEYPDAKPSEYYGEMVFDKSKMQNTFQKRLLKLSIMLLKKAPGSSAKWQIRLQPE